MKKIPLTKGLITLVDDEDYDFLSQWKWCAHSSGYAVRSEICEGKCKTIWMHRIIMNTPEGMKTDHKDGNRINNQKSNLRHCTTSQNGANRQSQKASSIYKGVSWNKKIKRWKSAIKINGNVHFLGWFKNEIGAALAYNNSAKKFFGEFAKLNEVK